MNMVSVNVQYSNNGITYETGCREFPYLDFNQFTITNNGCGMVSSIQVYSTFMVNPYGLIRFKDYINNVDTSLSSLQGEIALRAPTSACLSEADNASATP